MVASSLPGHMPPNPMRGSHPSKASWASNSPFVASTSIGSGTKKLECDTLRVRSEVEGDGLVVKVVVNMLKVAGDINPGLINWTGCAI